MARSDGLYERRGYWYWKYKSVDGAWIERASRTRNYAEARRLRAAFLRDLEEGKLPNERSRWTLQQAVDQWLADRKLRISAGSYASEATIARTLLRILGPDKRLSKVADIQVIHRYENSRLADGIKAKTVNNEVGVLAGILRDAKLWRRIEPDYKRLAVKKSDLPGALSHDEACRLIQVARVSKADAVAPYAAILSYSTGMRCGEIKQLQIGSIHLDAINPELQVRRATTKSDKGARHVALDSMAVWALRKLLNRAVRLGANEPGHYLLPTLLGRHTLPSDPLCGRSGWDPTHPQTSWEAEWDALRKSARIQHRRFHDLRHSFVSRAAEAGVPMPVLQAQVGHMNVAMTEHYTHITARAQQLAAHQIELCSADLLRQLGLTSRTAESQTSTSASPGQNRSRGQTEDADDPQGFYV